ncbi:single-stranded DNA-binding protein [Streptomyces roseoverticillatus]|uniref:single-stranded DNA-binding protein n=1 Tax=Streptomyces roseoverticillatus TaxID=66429 RepID=UPI001F22EC34|nr:single-stranded DNA-binding protein [Streptomyces roseoverticillatus]MCF3104516.1 single-stranded DNA-binding protein [Streptomyces roseoverticillatus]
MSFGETPITIIGNLTADPEIKFTTSGAALARFTVASTPRTFDKDSGQWRDGTSTFFRCAAWRSLAEHVGDSLAKGSRVVVSGRIRQHDWQTPEGENRSMLAVEVDEIGASLRFTTVTINGKRPTAASGTSDDPWVTAGAPATQKTAEEPPF